MTTRTIYIYDEDGNETECTLPMVWAICGCCDGEGRTSRHVERDGGGFTASEWAEEDQDFRDDYLAGAYARACDECRGSGKVCVVDYERLTDEQEAALRDEAEAEAYIRAEQAAERRFGC